MPTLCGMRRRGYTPEAIRAFLGKIGMAKRDSTVDIALLEHCVREDLNQRAPRVMGVLRPLRARHRQLPRGAGRGDRAGEQPGGPGGGNAQGALLAGAVHRAGRLPRGAAQGYFRLYPGNEVRLRGAFIVRCTGVVKDAAGEVVEVHCTYDPATRGGNAPDGRKVKSTIHWVSAAHAVEAEVRLYDTSSRCPIPATTRRRAGTGSRRSNPNSL